MEIGFIGLGKMGSSMVLNLAEKKHRIVVYDQSKEAIKKISKKKNITPSSSIEDLINKLPKRKIIWIMITAGKPIDSVIKSLLPNLKKGDIIIEGGNSYYKDSQKRYNVLAKHKVNFLDVGVSGGVSGARHGAAMMIGGNNKIFKHVEILFKNMCVDKGYGHMGESGAGHLVKALHNGIEYGMMGAIAEGIQAIKKSKLKLNTGEALKVYSHGTIIESKLMSWLEDGMQSKKYFNSFSGKVPKGYTEDEMKKLEKQFDLPVLNQARLMRERTRKKPSFAGKIISVMRNQFGGHPFFKK